MSSQQPRRILIFISGQGSNMRVLVDCIRRSAVDSCIEIVSDRADAAGLQWAKQAELRTHLIEYRQGVLTEKSQQNFMALLSKPVPDLILLAGFMRILDADFVRQYRDRLLNIHPSLLPKYPGLNTYRRVLAAGDAYHGATVHFVSEEVDQGPIVLSVRVPIEADESEASLKKKVQVQEHRIYPAVLDWFLSGRLHIDQNNQCYLDHKQIPREGLSWNDLSE